MTKKESAEKAIKIIKDYKSHSNKDLIFVMDFIQEDFNLTKETLIKLTHHLDKLELTYNQILKEFESSRIYEVRTYIHVDQLTKSQTIARNILLNASAGLENSLLSLFPANPSFVPEKVFYSELVCSVSSDSIHSAHVYCGLVSSGDSHHSILD